MPISDDLNDQDKRGSKLSMQLLNEAYEVLRDTYQRLKYDNYKEKKVFLTYFTYLKLMWNSKKKVNDRRRGRGRGKASN